MVEGDEEIEIEDVDDEQIIESAPIAQPPPNIADDDLIGSRLGTYRMLDLLGQGGMGRVYLGEHVKIGRKAAIKVLRKKYSSRPDIVNRFFTEARTVNQIQHENIIDIIDFVEDDEGRAYLVMELLSGFDLRDLVREHWPLPIRRVVDIFVQIADGLAAAHAAGVIHRDLKPDNVFLVKKPGRDDFVKLVDFGVAKLLGTTMGSDYKAGTVIGTPAYMSPEQAAGLSKIDHRADIYSFGAMLYRVIAGHTPFQGRTVADYIRAHIKTAPVPPSHVDGLPEVMPDSLERVVLRCMEKSPSARFQSMGDVAVALRKVQRELDPSAEPQVIRRGPSTGTVALITAGILGALAAAVFLVSRGGPDAASASDPSSAAAHSEATSHEPVAMPAESTLSFRSMPEGANVFHVGSVHDDPLCVTPCQESFPRVDEDAEFRFEKAGYDPYITSFPLGADGTLQVVLDEIAAAIPPPETAGPKRPVAKKSGKGKRPSKPADDKPKTPKKPKGDKLDATERWDPFGGK